MRNHSLPPPPSFDDEDTFPETPRWMVQQVEVIDRTHDAAVAAPVIERTAIVAVPPTARLQLLRRHLRRWLRALRLFAAYSAGVCRHRLSLALRHHGR